MKKFLFTVAFIGSLAVGTANAQSFQLVKDLYPETESLLYDYDAGMTFFDGKLYFTSYYGDIVVSDGTSSGTQIISNLGMQKMTALDFHKNRFVPMANKLYYKNSKNELCVTDGTSAGTSMVADIYTTDESTFYGVRTILGATSDKLFFVGNDGVSGLELWVSDGTATGTKMVSDKVPGVLGFFGSTTSKHHIGTVINNKLYFFAKDATNGWEPWVSDGTEAGTFMLINSNPNGDCSTGMASTFGGYAGSEMKFFSFKNEVYFTAYSGIYKTDGTVAGTSLVLSGASFGANLMTSMCVFDGHLYFDQFIGGKRFLTKSDGTMSGTVVVDTLSGTLARGFQEFNGQLYFRCKPNTYSSSDKDYIAKLIGSQIFDLTRSTSGYFNYSVDIIQPVGNDFLYMGDYNNHAIYRYNNGENTLANTDFTSTYDNLLSTPIGTFAIGTNAQYGYELWKWNKSTTGIKETDFSNFRKVYPNPTSKIINIELDQESHIRIINYLGVEVLSQQLNTGFNSINVAHLSKGIYFIRDEKGSIQKFIKE